MLRVCTSSTESSLVSLTAYKAAVGTTTTADDEIMQSALNRALALIEGYLGHPLRRHVYHETMAGYGSLELRVSRTPLIAVESVSYDSEKVDPTTYSIASQGGGILYRQLGWPWTAGIQYDLMPRVVPGGESQNYTVVYEAGYCMNGSTADGWVSTGELVPTDIEAAIIAAATYLYKGASRDPAVASKRIGDLSITYHGGGQQAGSVDNGLPNSVKGLVAHLRRF